MRMLLWRSRALKCFITQQYYPDSMMLCFEKAVDEAKSAKVDPLTTTKFFYAPCF
jgi:hypothetical protein